MASTIVEVGVLGYLGSYMLNLRYDTADCLRCCVLDFVFRRVLILVVRESLSRSIHEGRLEEGCEWVSCFGNIHRVARKGWEQLSIWSKFRVR